MKMFGFALLGLLALLQVGDILTTDSVLRKGGVELNPSQAFWQKHLGMDLWWIPKVVFLLGLGAAAASMGLWWALLPVDAYYVWVVWHNWNVLRKM